MEDLLPLASLQHLLGCNDHRSRQIGKHESREQFTDNTLQGIWFRTVTSSLLFWDKRAKSLLLFSLLKVSFVSGVHHRRVLPPELEGRASVLQRAHGDAAVKQPARQQHLDP